MRISQTPQYLHKVSLEHLGKIFFSVMFLLVSANSSLEKVTAQKDDPSNVWIQTARIKRPPLPKSKIRRKPVDAPLLTMRWQVLFKEEMAESCKPTPVDVTKHSFANGDLLRLALQVNQEGYLYVISQTEMSGEIIRAPQQINLGQDKTEVDFKQILPATCPEGSERCGDCYWEVKKPAGLDIITVIFSREQIPQLINPNNSSRTISASFIQELREKAGKPRRELWGTGKQAGSAPSGLIGQHVFQVWNPNVRNNELLIERIELKHP